MIPKIIHFCWFGKGEKNRTIKMCMKSWGKYCKNYKFMEWNEETFDLKNAPLYVREAYEMKKWAFVSDYVRLWALYNHGGVYFDTDVKIIKPLDFLLKGRGFSGFSEIKEGDFQIPAAVMGAQKYNSYIKYLLSYYKTRSFKLKNGQPNLKANVYIITEMTLKRFKFKLNNTYQTIKDYEYYPTEYFTPKFEHHRYGPITTSDTYAIHYHNESWMPWYEKLKIDFLIVLSIIGIKKPLRWLLYRAGILK